MSGSAQRTIVVGVVARQPDAVVTHAAALAAELGARLVCATVDPGRYAVEERPDGGIRSAPLDPDLEAHLRAVLEPTSVPWETRALAGDPARALARLAETVDAMLIVVGTHEGGLRGTLHELFNGSVAAHLAHRQHRPVVVIPLSPVGLDAALPWDSGS